MSKKNHQQILKFSLFLICIFLTPIAWGKVIYVAPIVAGNNDGTSWDNAYGNLQTAINNAAVGDSLWVKEGTYIPTIHVTSSTSTILRFFGLNKNIKIFGGFKGDETSFDQRDWVNNKTIMSGDINKNNSSNTNYTSTLNRTDDNRRIFVAIGNLVDAEVDGFYMRNTYSGSSSYTQTWNSVTLKSDFHGVLINNCSGLTLRNLDISFMYSNGMTGLNIYQSTINLENIKIQEIYSSYSNNNFNASKVTAKNIFVNHSSSRNSTSGIAFYADKKSTIENLKIKNTSSPNWGVLDIFNCDTLRINRLDVSFNKSGSMAALSIEKSKAILSNALITNNQTTSTTTAISILNGSDAASKSYIKLVNATITKNTSSTTNTNYVFSASYDNQIDLRNSIIMNSTLYFNKVKFSYLFNNYFSSYVSATYSLNNIISYMDPFLDYANNNFQLQIGSLARNGGDSTFLLQTLNVANLNNQLDVHGNPRRNQAGKLDIGAVEDTLVDALLNTLRYEFQAKIQQNQTIIQSNIHSTEFVQLKLKAGINENNLFPIQQYVISAEKNLDEQLILPYTHYNIVEWWAVNQLGQEVLLKRQNLSTKGKKMELSIFPNPAIDQISVIGINERIQKIQLMDITGKLIQSYEIKQSSSNYKITLSSLKPGVYLLAAISADDIQTIRFIKR